MAKMRLPKGVKPEEVGVADFAVGGAMDPGDIRKALGGVTGPHSMDTMKRLTEVFRPKDLSKVLPRSVTGPSQVPGAPPTAEKIDSAFEAYLQRLAEAFFGGR